MSAESADDRRARTLLRAMFDAAVERAMPADILPALLPDKPRGRCVVVGAGKASAAMAAAIDSAWPDVDLSGLIVAPDGEAAGTGRIRIIAAAHPVPDQRSLDAGTQILAAVGDLAPDDLVLALISGGGSSLMVAPAPPMTLADKQEVNRLLLASGAPIAEMNVVRKHLSMIKGGRLALAAAPARVVSLLVSDVPGDAPEAIASGPTVGDPSTLDDVREILARRCIALPARALAALERSRETPVPGDLAADVRIVAAPSASLAAAAHVAEQTGIRAMILGDAIEGEARDVAQSHAVLAKGVSAGLKPGARSYVLISGGETTVTVTGAGRGGRNTEYLLALGVALDGAAGVHALAADTDGVDGVEDNAGAFLDPGSLSRAERAGALAAAHLADNDAYGFFAAIGGLVFTGPTRTNVNDFRAIIVEPPPDVSRSG